MNMWLMNNFTKNGNYNDDESKQATNHRNDDDFNEDDNNDGDNDEEFKSNMGDFDLWESHNNDNYDDFEDADDGYVGKVDNTAYIYMQYMEYFAWLPAQVWIKSGSIRDRADGDGCSIRDRADGDICRGDESGRWSQVVGDGLS